MSRPLRNFDIAMSSLVARIPNSYSPLMTFASKVGDFWLVIFTFFSLIISAFVFNNTELLKTTATLGVLVPLAEIAKLITRRKRPETLYVQQMKFKTYSFPSGHSYVSALICGYLILLLSTLSAGLLGIVFAGILLAFTLIIGVSRVYLGAHFPSDVIAGWLFALLMITLHKNISS
ncbi:MAG TPA: phosphatase PAP2 family protein [Candidatus Dormibacteraeota bacterium]|nr:phosphatase PAP2 family protein [Candidatus Dormibacteraeota bacterium]